MTKTTNYQLNQWAKSDRIMMDDFNADNQKIDAALAACGNCKISYGSYTGTGEYGTAHPCSLTFSFEPKLLIIGLYNEGQGDPVHFIKGNTAYFCRNVGGTSGIHGTLSFQGNTVSWYSTDSEKHQLNYSGWPYIYLAIG